ncbi:DNA polymerase I, partial [Haematococcus lacustris]
RELHHLKTSSLEGLRAAVLASHDGRVHPSFNQIGTATGRLSCTNPNLMALPARGPQAALLRAACRAQAGWSILSADYS